VRKPVVFLALVAVGAALVTPAAAAPKLAKSKPLVIKDVAGDATGLGAAAPTSQADADIISFTLSRKDKGKKVTALVGKLTLAAAPTEGHDYRIVMSVEGCSTYYLEYEYAAVLGGNSYIRQNCDGAPTSTFTDVTADIVGKSVVWTVPISALPGPVKVGTPLNVEKAEAVLHEGAVIFGVLDEAPAPEGTTYKVGQ
jgi:hypothetical protein